jgi:hypothetical protein
MGSFEEEMWGEGSKWEQTYIPATTSDNIGPKNPCQRCGKPTFNRFRHWACYLKSDMYADEVGDYSVGTQNGVKKGKLISNHTHGNTKDG